MQQEFLIILFTFLILIIFPLSAWASVSLSAFPDRNFRKVLQRYDNNGDGILEDKEIARIKELDVSSMGISTLEGVQHLTALQRLWCKNNQLTELDVSGCYALQELWCKENRLTKLNVSGCSALEKLDCDDEVKIIR